MTESWGEWRQSESWKKVIGITLIQIGDTEMTQ